MNNIIAGVLQYSGSSCLASGKAERKKPEEVNGQ